MKYTKNTLLDTHNSEYKFLIIKVEKNIELKENSYTNNQIIKCNVIFNNEAIDIIEFKASEYEKSTKVA